MSTILAFHAHPDDESVSTGVTLAKYADEGHRVVVVTATDGSAGEIHNYENPEELFPKLAEMRKEEWLTSCVHSTQGNQMDKRKERS